MTDLYVEGPDALKVFSDLGINSFKNFKVNQAKQFVACNQNGYVIGDAILFYLDQNKLNLVGRPPAANWVQYNVETRGYKATVIRDERSAVNAGQRKVFRYQIQGPNAAKVMEKVTPLPTALDPNFEFRKTKLFFMSEKGLKPSERARQESSNKIGGGKNSPNQKTATLQDAPIVFERQYRLFGAVSGLDARQRFGNYFDFFWRVKHPSDVTVRLEYRQEKLHEHVQAQEISDRNVRGTNKTECKVIGDDYFDDGRVIAWRCLLIANGRIVAENRSFLWEQARQL